MPELPEVETLVSQLRQSLSGSVLSTLQIFRSEVLKSDFKSFEKLLPGKKIQKVSRRGKFIAIEFGEDAVLWFHLGMTGQLFWRDSETPTDKHVHLALKFEAKPERLFFRDVRRFGKVILTQNDPMAFPPGIRKMGPEPLEMAAAEFVTRYKGRSGRIKSLLLNQHLVAGVGNIYADESLFRARIDPRKRPSRLSREVLGRLHGALCETLQEAIAAGGSSINDYFHINGNSGRFQNSHRVYGREGEPCRKCGDSIRRIFLAGRSSYYCPQCQK
jgi:formamidopyrimidine-DNA glycosylase